MTARSRFAPGSSSICGRAEHDDATVDEATLPGLSKLEAPCPRCGKRTCKLVMFDRNCREVTGDHRELTAAGSRAPRP
jgi:hypothetical protein